VKRPVTKNAIVTRLVDADPAQAAQTLGVLHALQASRPDIQIVPSHDLDALQSVPACSGSLDRADLEGAGGVGAAVKAVRAE